MLKDELELVNSLTSTLSSFKEDPGSMGGGARQRPPLGRAGGGGAKEDRVSHSRDPDVWPPPTPVEAR